jgi:Zn-dependent protease
MFGSFKLCSAYGIPIRVHITLLLLLPYFSSRMIEALGVRSPIWGTAAAVGLFVCVALHELGHSVAAMKLGYSVRDIILTPIGGIAYLRRIPERPSHEIRIAIAGPVVSFLLAAAFLGLSLAVAAAGLGSLALSLELLSAINLVLALFNLVPCFPMDGGRVFRAWLSRRLGRVEATRRAVRLGRVLALVFGILGLANLEDHWGLVLIAVFVYWAGSSEYRTVRLQEIMRRGLFDPPGGFPPPPERPAVDAEVSVGPPPYDR